MTTFAPQPTSAPLIRTAARAARPVDFASAMKWEWWNVVCVSCPSLSVSVSVSISNSVSLPLSLCLSSSLLFVHSLSFHSYYTIVYHTLPSWKYGLCFIRCFWTLSALSSDFWAMHWFMWCDIMIIWLFFGYTHTHTRTQSHICWLFCDLCIYLHVFPLFVCFVL